MGSAFHGKDVIHPEEFIQSVSSIDLDRIAFGLLFFPETGFADFFACDREDLIEIPGPAYLQNFIGYNGFVAFPFQNGSNGYFIPQSLRLPECISRRFEVEGFFREKIDAPAPDLALLEMDSEVDYKEKVKKALAAIQNGEFEKVVLSRCKKVPFQKEKLSGFLQRVFEQYPKANLMVFNIPGKGLWISASPEILLAYGYSILGAGHSSLVGHALAGTKPAASDQPWDEKEIREQAIVSNYIESAFKEVVPHEAIQKFGPSEQVAGNLRHLSSIYHVAGGNAALVMHLASRLHPTPAVCGFPFEQSFGWLIENENLDRSFFSGFAGSIHPERIKFIVNLRTACYRDEHLLFYAGAGIVRDSDPENELAETDSKINTLASLIDS
jgi:isochorismate synthase